MTRPDTIAVEDFLRPPERTRATISPDGTRLAYLAPWRGRMNVWVEDLDDDGAAPRRVTTDDVRSIPDYHWTADPRWMLHTQDDGGDENHHLYRIDLDTPGAPAVDLTPWTGVRVLDVDLPSRRPDVVVARITGRTGPAIELCEIDIGTGSLTVVSGDVADADSAHWVGDGSVLLEHLTPGHRRA